MYFLLFFLVPKRTKKHRSRIAHGRALPNCSTAKMEIIFAGAPQLEALTTRKEVAKLCFFALGLPR